MKKLKKLLIVGGIMTSLSFFNCYAMEKDNFDNFNVDGGKKQTYTQQLQNKVRMLKLKIDLMKDSNSVQELSDKIVVLKKKIDDLNGALRESKEKSLELETKNIRQEEIINNLKKKNKELKPKEENKNFKKENKNLKEENKNFKKENKKLKEENKNFKKENKNLKEENKNLKEENKKLLERWIKAEHASKEKKGAENKYLLNIKELENERDALKNELYNLKGVLRELQERSFNLVIENTHQQKVIDELKKK